MTTNNALVVTAERGVPFVDTVRVVNAPVADVYRAHIDPALVAQWMGPRGLTTEILDWDARIGGTWAFTQAGPDGADGAPSMVSAASSTIRCPTGALSRPSSTTASPAT